MITLKSINVSFMDKDGEGDLHVYEKASAIANRQQITLGQLVKRLLKDMTRQGLNPKYHA